MYKRVLPCVIAVVSFGSILSPCLAQQFVDVSSQVGFVMQAKKSKGNPVWGDFNNDGVLDLIVPCHGLSVSHGPFVYLGNANGTFTDIRDTCGFSNVKAHQIDPSDYGDWHGFALGDYDNDGNLDLYIGEGAKGQTGGTLKRDLLFHGNGNGTFTYVSDTAGIITSGDRGREGFWVDYDNDGKLDLFVKNFKSANGYYIENHFYHNNGNGMFTEVPGACGLADASFGKHASAVTSFIDYDNDGFMDVAFSGEGASEALYHNNGDGTFVNVTTAAGLKKSKLPCQGIAWGDYNNDGYLDLYVARGNLNGVEPFGDTLYRNNGNGTFTDVTQEAGITASGNDWAAVWGDYDNDGYLDLFVACAGTNILGPGNANHLYHNNGDGTFTDAAVEEGLALQDNASPHRAAAWADYDNDGFLDLILKDGVGQKADEISGGLGLHRLFRNQGNADHFIKIKLVGVQSNRDGIGVRVTVTYAAGLSNRIAFRENNGAGGGEFWSQGSEPLHVGIGQADVAAVTVRWPSGTVDTQQAVFANSTITITEGAFPTP